jgi:hypothetical protein
MSDTDESQDRITDAHRTARGMVDADVAAALSDAYRQGQAAGAGELLDLLTMALGTALEYHRPRQGLAYIAGALETVAEVHRRQVASDDALRAAPTGGAA